jgi:hypothetical protein
VIPVEVTQAPWHATGFWDWVDHWQTLIAGALAFAAGVGTVVVAMRVIAATREQTETTIRLEELRNAREASAFHLMLESAMVRVIVEMARAKSEYPYVLTRMADTSVDAYVLRQCITKGAFAELRASCVRLGGLLTAEFLDLEREIDSFASQWRDLPWAGVTRREGLQAGLGDQLAEIEKKVAALREKAAERI